MKEDALVTPNVLVVDDDLMVCNLIRKTFRRAHYDVAVASTISEAQSLLDTFSANVVLCDQHLPSGDGLTFLSELRQSHPHIQRILMTGAPSEQIAMRGINEAHIASYLNKPCTTEELIAAVDFAFAETRLQEEAKRRSPVSSIRQIVAASILGLITVALTSAILFFLLYLLKSALGIDLIPALHLEDVL